MLPAVLVGTVATDSTHVQVVGRIGRVEDTRWAGHNQGRILTERVATFPVDAEMMRVFEREREREEERVECTCTCTCVCVCMCVCVCACVHIHDVMIRAKLLNLHLLELFVVVYHTLQRFV